MAPLTIPQRPQGGRGPLFGLSPGGAWGQCRAIAPEARARAVSFYGGAKRCAVARFRRELVPRVGSSGENVAGFLVFELGALFALLLWQRVANLGSRSGEQGRRSSLRKRTFVCN